MNYGNYAARIGALTRAIRNTQADIVFIEEFLATGVPHLTTMLNVLNGMMPGQEWYADWLPGALAPGALPPYATNANLAFTPTARGEGYAVLWRQNIAKFIMQIADPIEPATVGMPAAPVVANTQSNSALARVGGAVPAALVGNITVPVAMGVAAYTLPAGSNIGIGGIVRGGLPVPGAGAGLLGVAVPLMAGDIISSGTIIGPGGITLTAVTQGVNPIVIPQGFIIGMGGFTLPANGAVVVPQHALSLVLVGRPFGVGAHAGFYMNYNPAGGTGWTPMLFADGIGVNRLLTTRRPATCTIRTSRITGGGGAPVVLVPELIPITVYHTPLRAPGMRGMGTAAFSRSLYEAYDHAVGAYAPSNMTLIGGDFNKRLTPNAGHYQVFALPFGAAGGSGGGAECQTAGLAPAPLIRVNTPFPPGGLPAPVYPPLPAAPGPANNPVNKSLITIRQNFTGPWILSANRDHYRSSSFDNVFYRGFTAAQAPAHTFGSLYFICAAVSGAGAPVGAANFYLPAGTIFPFTLLAPFVPPPMAPLAAIPNVFNQFALSNDVIAGGFGNAVAAAGVAPVATGVVNPLVGAVPVVGAMVGPGVPAGIVTPQRRATEFVKLFISDHLPTIFKMSL